MVIIYAKTAVHATVCWMKSRSPCYILHGWSGAGVRVRGGGGGGGETA